MRSFSILKTNVGLTTNVKVMVVSDYSLYLESIDSDSNLANDKYKHFSFNSSSYYDELLPAFYTGNPQNTSSAINYSSTAQLSIDTAMAVKYDNDSSIMYTSFDNQFDDIYQMGCRNIIDNKNYGEEFECFAPLYIGSDSFPSNFIVLRIDGPGLIELNPSNFRSQIINNFKCVKIFDLNKNTNVGQWIDTNFISNDSFPDTPFYMDFRDLEFSYWNGIDYEVGGYANRPFFLNTTLEYENTFFDFESLIYDGYKNNKIVFPNIINFSFLFDDTPSTPESLRTWSLNRYMGFYLDSMDLVDKLNPYTLPSLKDDAVILGGNILSSPSSLDNPFVDDWISIKSPYVEINGNFYQVQQYTRSYEPDYYKVKLSKNVYSDKVVPYTQNFYKIISDVSLMGLTVSSINNNSIIINSDNSVEFTNGSDLIPQYDTADLWILKIDNINHVIVKDNGSYYIQSDYGFSMSKDKLVYYTNGTHSTHTIDLSITSTFNPISFSLYRCNFTDIKDFDTSIVDTDFSRFEYELPLQLTKTDETKLYYTNYNSVSIPPDLDDFVISGQVVNIPVSSEYTSNGETFRLQNTNGSSNTLDLSPIWRKNPIRCKWGYQNSISSSDYPYLLNNSFISEDFNRTVNVVDPIPDRRERNLDYFYSINSSTSSYSYHSLHVENHINGDIDTNFKFEIDQYVNNDYDYFSYFFGKKSELNKGQYIYNTSKWSTFEVGDNVVPNSTVFRGMKFNLYDVSDIKSNSVSIDSINLLSKNSYQGYKFSILLSDNDYKINPSPSDISVGVLEPTSTSFSWKIIDNWKHDNTYATGSVVSYYDILYKSIKSNSISDPSQNPALDTIDWVPVSWSATSSIFWSPTYNYQSGDFVYNYGEYYYYDPSNGDATFWSPFEVYNYQSEVLFQGKTWISTTQSNVSQPGSLSSWSLNGISKNYWESKEVSTSWLVVEIWSPSNVYNVVSITRPNSTTNTQVPPYVVYDNILYQLINDTSLVSSGDIPGISLVWNRIYSIIPDTDYIYGPSNNPIISLNNKYYYCSSNVNNSTLENGICVYINKKYKNILVNIFVNDNTLSELNNSDRDELYNDLYINLTAANFINCINDLANKHGFSDYLQYVVINEDGSLNTYNFNNISQLKSIFFCQLPDQFYSRIQSLDRNVSTLSGSQIKPINVLNNGTVVTLDMIDYYNGDPLAMTINKKSSDQSLIPNYSGLKNNIYNSLYRHSGYYSPIFYNIPLFSAPSYQDSVIGNYKFDTSLSDFGIMKERVISKVSDTNILKLSNDPNINSVYPMLDEFGYTYMDYFIFKSTWDYKYYLQCGIPSILDNNLISNNNILKP